MEQLRHLQQQLDQHAPLSLPQQLYNTAWLGRVGDVKHLVEGCGVNPSHTWGRLVLLDFGYDVILTPIVMAIRGGDHLDVVKYLVKACHVPEEEKSAALLYAFGARRHRCAVWLLRHGTLPFHGPFPKAYLAKVYHMFVAHPLSFAAFLGLTTAQVSGMLAEYKWTPKELSTSFCHAVSLRRWERALLFLQAGASPTFVRKYTTKCALDAALDDADCPMDLRKLLWAKKLEMERMVSVQLLRIFHGTFAGLSHEFQQKTVTKPYAIVTRSRVLTRAKTITSDPLFQSLLVKGQTPATAQSELMSFLMNDHRHALPVVAFNRIVSFLGPDGVDMRSSLTYKMLTRRGFDVDKFTVRKYLQ